ANFEGLKQRREARKGYQTTDGFWQDPPNYFANHRVKSQDFSVVVFDTAPTGHTLRFLQFPTILETALGKIKELSAAMGPMLGSLMGGQGQDVGQMLSKLDETRETIMEVNRQFQNPDLTTFVCVCIAEFLSLYETERMIQELTGFGIDTNTIIVNQLVKTTPDDQCKRCVARAKLQGKYVEQIHELYEDFHIYNNLYGTASMAVGLLLAPNSIFLRHHDCIFALEPLKF
ncbi:ATPase GET3, partial [Lucilia cuprina]